MQNEKRSSGIDWNVVMNNINKEFREQCERGDHLLGAGTIHNGHIYYTCTRCGYVLKQETGSYQK